MFKKIVKLLVPPIFLILYGNVKRKIKMTNENSNLIFDGDDSLFKKVLANTQLYGEYGCGESTKWVLNHSQVHVVAVDTSRQWIQEVLANNSRNNGRLTIKHANLGELRGFGRPIDYSRRDYFKEYTDWIWEQSKKPDTVLIDGRFRVCCFLTSLKYAEEGTHIIFDDYTSRPRYHIIEKYVDRVEECGRQCLFIVPAREKLDFEDLEKDIVNFRYVMD